MGRSSATQQGTNQRETHSVIMDGNKTIGPLALRRIGEVLRKICGIPRKLPLRLYDLIAQLRRVTKEDDAQSAAEKTHLVTLAEGWVELAEKAHEDNHRPRQPTILHPLVERKLGKFAD
jgi:hypothetical protein